jgi:hypothetical protein
MLLAILCIDQEVKRVRDSDVALDLKIRAAK